MSRNDEIEKKQQTIREELIVQYIKYRKMKHLTQDQLATSMGIKRPNISRFETGQSNPTLDLLVKMAECMDLDIKVELVEKGREMKDEKEE